jgi:protease YdgD
LGSLELDGPIPVVAPLPMAAEPPPSGEAIAVAGYNQDRAEVLMADRACHITGAAMVEGKPLIADDCDATRGTSGGLLLVRHGGSWAVEMGAKRPRTCKKQCGSAYRKHSSPKER